MIKSEWAEWQKPYQFGTFIIHPPDTVRAVVNPLRAKYSPIASSYSETHITLTQPFLKQPTEKDWRLLERIVATFEPFTITYGPLRTWSSGRIIYFEIQPVDKILSLRKGLHETGLFNLRLPHTDDFIPHITVQEGYAEGSARDIIDVESGNSTFEKLKTSLKGDTFLCNKITFITPDSQFRFTVKKHLPFATNIDV